MKRIDGYNRSVRVAAGLVPWLFAGAMTAWATTHVINFGGGLGNKYSPATLAAAIGDTITWVGSFTVHPLSSTTIPSGAATWHDASGSSFSYVIAVAGTYNYKCDLHSGMTGSFTAGSTGSAPRGSAIAEKTSVKLLPAITGSRNIRVSVPRGGMVMAKMFSLDGRELAADIIQAPAAGIYPLAFGGTLPARGMYCVEVEFGEKSISRIFGHTR